VQLPVEAARRIILRGPTEEEANELVRLLQKAIAAGHRHAALRVVSENAPHQTLSLIDP